VFPDNRRLLTEFEHQSYVDIIKRNVMQRYRGMAAIFSSIYAVDGRILAEGKSFRYWNGRRWLSDGSFHVQSVFSSHISRILRWYENVRLAAFKREIWKHMKKSEEWGRIAEASEYSLPEWANRP
jgi:hypothetical protein